MARVDLKEAAQDVVEVLNAVGGTMTRAELDAALAAAGKTHLVSKLPQLKTFGYVKGQVSFENGEVRHTYSVVQGGE